MRTRFIVIFVILCIAALGYFGGYIQYLDPDRLREVIAKIGPWGPLAMVGLFTILEPFGAPGAIFMMASATLWPFGLAFAVNICGATGAGMLGFAFARYLGRDWAEGRMSERMRAWDERLSERGLPKVIAFRAVFFLNPTAHWALGLSRVRVPAAILGTILGFSPGVGLWTFFGAEILDWFNEQSTGVWISIGVAILAAVLYLRFRRRTANSAQDNPI